MSGYSAKIESVKLSTGNGKQLISIRWSSHKKPYWREEYIERGVMSIVMDDNGKILDVLTETKEPDMDLVDHLLAHFTNSVLKLGGKDEP